jgi:hypothetical protein
MSTKKETPPAEAQPGKRVLNGTQQHIEDCLMPKTREYVRDLTKVSCTGIKKLLRSAAHYEYEYLTEGVERDEQSDALIFGSALHTMTFEPEDFMNAIAIMPKMDRRTNVGKAEYEKFHLDNAGKTIITPEMHVQAKIMVAKIKAHPAVDTLFDFGWAERALTFTDPETEVDVLIKLDWIDGNGLILSDVKSCEDASPIAFGKQFINYGYDIQAALYVDGFYQATGIEPGAFVVIAVEKSQPHNVAVYYVNEEVLALGRKKYKRALRLYAECKNSGIWPGYGDEAMVLVVPNWAYSQF